MPIVNNKKSESEEERIDWGSSKSNQFSDELKSDNQQILEDVEDDTIMSKSACSSDIQYCQTFSTSYYEWITGQELYFWFFRGFGSSPVDPSITRMFLMKFSTFLWRFQKLNFKTFLEIFVKSKGQ